MTPASLSSRSPRPRVLEFFAGIGGMSAAWPEAEVVAAVEIDHSAAEVYRANFAAPVFEKEIASLPDDWLGGWNADVWWLSPPCTPFTRKGRQRDLEDPRNRGLLRLIEAIPAIRPPAIAIENVVGFESSATFEHLQLTLARAGYHVQWCQLCPTQLGWPNRRPRIYILASQQPLPAWQPLPVQPVRLRDVISATAPAESVDRSSNVDFRSAKVPVPNVDFRSAAVPAPNVDFRSAKVPAFRGAKGDTGTSQPPAPDCASEPDLLWLDPETAHRYWNALDRVSLGDDQAVTACFTRSYGRTLVRSGSWLAEGSSFRRFSPAEVATLIGFPPTFRWPDNIHWRRRWQLLGNSLSLPAVRYVIAQLKKWWPLGVNVVNGANNPPLTDDGT